MLLLVEDIVILLNDWLFIVALIPFCVGLDFICPPLAMPLGSTATFNCSDPSTSGFDVKSSLLPHDIPIFGNVPRGYVKTAEDTACNLLLTVSMKLY